MTRLDSSKCGYIANASSVQSCGDGQRPGVAVPAHRGGRRQRGGRCTVRRALPARAEAISTTSKPRARRTSSVAVEGRSHARQPRRFGAPTITRVALRICAYSASVAAADGPSSVTVSAAEGLGQPQHVDAPVAFGFATGAAAPASRRTPRSTRHRVHRPCACRRAPAARPARPARPPPARDRRRGAPRARSARQRARGGLDAVGDAAQRDLAQRHQVRLAEEALDRRDTASRQHTPCPRAAARSGHPAADR